MSGLLHVWLGGLTVSLRTEALSTLLLRPPEPVDFPSLGLSLGHKMAAAAPSISSSHNLLKAGIRRSLSLVTTFIKEQKPH